MLPCIDCAAALYSHLLLHTGEVPSSVSAWRLSIPNEFSCCFLQSFQVNASVVPQIRL